MLTWTWPGLEGHLLLHRLGLGLGLRTQYDKLKVYEAGFAGLSKRLCDLVTKTFNIPEDLEI